MRSATKHQARLKTGVIPYQNRANFSVVLAAAAIIGLLPSLLLAQLSRLDERELPFQTTADTGSVPKIVAPTTLRAKSTLRLPVPSYHVRPRPPYFRDDYRLVQDLRRLVQMVEYRAVHGYESVNELVQIARQLPTQKQTAMIGMAVTGGAVNIIADATNRHLRKMKIDFVEWKVEKIVLRKRTHYFHTNIQSGLTNRGLGVYVPALRTQFYRDVTPYYKSEGLIFYSRRHLGFDVSRENGNLIWTPFYFSWLGTIQISYNSTRQIIRSKIDLRRSSFFVLRLVMIDQLKQPDGKFLLGEAIISW